MPGSRSMSVPGHSDGKGEGSGAEMAEKQCLLATLPPPPHIMKVFLPPSKGPMYE